VKLSASRAVFVVVSVGLGLVVACYGVPLTTFGPGRHRRRVDLVAPTLVYDIAAVHEITTDPDWRTR
jgi:hypothetical protein